MFMDQWKDEKEMDVSSDGEPYDSDQIDSDVEAELYSVIHHETDHSTKNYEDSFNSLNTSNKENYSMSLHYEEFSFSNVNFEKSKQIVSHNNNNSTNIEKKFTTFLQSTPFKRKSNSDSFILDDTQSCSKKQKNNQQNTCEVENKILNSKLSETAVLTSSEDDDDNDIVCLKPSDMQLSSDDDNDIVRLKPLDMQQFSDDDNDIVHLKPSDMQQSSDDDNDIICIEPLDKQKHFETNVSQIVVVDSDSDTADSWCFKSTKSKTSIPSATLKKNDLWFVNDEDLYRSRRSSNRYHESQGTICNVCNQKGHSEKFCSFSKGPKCYICGGKHGFFRCKKRICAKCFGMGHDIKYCPKGIDLCAMCQMPGHHQNICPDLWRRFQRTTAKKTKKIWRLFQDTPFFCYNCGLPGHFGPLCKGRRMNAPSFPTWPFVLNYKVSNQTKVNSKAKPVINAVTEESFIDNGQQGQVPKVKRKKKKVKKSLPGMVTLQQISFPRTPKNNNQTVPNTETNSIDKNTKLKKMQLRQEARKAKRLRRRQRIKEKKAVMAKEIVN